MTLILSSESRLNIFFDKKVVTCHPLYHNYVKMAYHMKTAKKQYKKSTEKQQFLSIMCFLTNILAGRSVFKVKKKRHYKLNMLKFTNKDTRMRSASIFLVNFKQIQHINHVILLINFSSYIDAWAVPKNLPKANKRHLTNF